MGGLAPFGTGDHKLHQLLGILPNFSQIGDDAAEIRLAEVKKEKITALKYKSSRTLACGAALIKKKSQR